MLLISRFQRKSIPGLLIEISNPDQIRHLVFTGDNLAQPPGRLGFVVQVPAYDRHPRGLGNVPEAGPDRPDLFACPFGHDGQEKFIPRVECICHLLHNALMSAAIDRDAAKDMEQDGQGPEKGFLLDHDVPCPLDDPKARKGPDGVHVGRVGKTDDHVFLGKIGRQWLEPPAHQEIEQPPRMAQDRFHDRYLLQTIQAAAASLSRIFSV